ncbi:MAG: response regulator [Burkholderiales bacterium]|nr:response regulator [Burkholderiales bacterium]
MKRATATAKVLVATDNVDDANQILRQLKSDFENVRASTDPDRAVDDFDEFKPDVLMLAFDTLDKAQTYYLGLYRLSPLLQQHPHRTVILCRKEEVRQVFDLCKKEYFDDYVLYWPHTFDGPRLAMSVWVACREMKATQPDALRSTELLAHARHLGDLERTLGRELTDGEQHADAARSTLKQVEQEIAGVLDEFSSRLARGGAADWLDVKDAAALQREIEQLKHRQIMQTRRVGAATVEPMGAWARNLKDQIQPALAGTRALIEKVQKIRPIVMVVEDDEMTQQLISHTLDPKAYEILLVGDGRAALSQLRRMQPDVILMDIRLPGMDGVEITQRLKATPRLAAIPVIMMTGDARRETLLHSLEVGAVEFIVKPFSRESLTSKLEKVLAR